MKPMSDKKMQMFAAAIADSILAGIAKAFQPSAETTLRWCPAIPAQPRPAGAKKTGPALALDRKNRPIVLAKKKARDMSCRVNGCVRRSLGPRFRYFCTHHHDNLPEINKKQELAAYRKRKAD
jgi:hypothetical protein